MASSFKTPCPSCEAMVLIKDPSLIGKKIECPKCKDRFVVPKQATPKAKPKDEDDEVDEVEEVEEKPKKKGKKDKTKPVKAEDADAEGKPKKKSGKSNKKTLTLALAGIGILILAVAGYFIMTGGSTPTGPKPGAIAKGPGVTPPPQAQAPDTPADPMTPVNPLVASPGTNDIIPQTLPKTTENPSVDPVVAKVTRPAFKGTLIPADAKLTNLLPNETEQVTHVFFKNVFEKNNPIRDSIFGPAGFSDDDFYDHLGFSALAIDDLIRAEHFTGKTWAFTVLHLMDGVDMNTLEKALGLKPQAPVNGQAYYQIKGSSPYFRIFANLTFGSDSLPINDSRTVFLHKRDDQTLVFADEPPMLAYLKAEGKIPVYPSKTGAKKGEIKMSLERDPYLTVKPELKAVLDSVEDKKGEVKLYYSAAADMVAAQNAKDARGLLTWKPRPLWDLSTMLEESHSRVRTLGSALVMKEQIWELRQQLGCAVESDAKDLAKDLVERSAPAMIRYADMFLGHKIELQKDPGQPPPPPPSDPAAPPPPPGTPPPPPPEAPKIEEVTSSRLLIKPNGKDVYAALDLVLDPEANTRLIGLLNLYAMRLKSEADLATFNVSRFTLARAGKELGEKGLPDRDVRPGSYPPGAFKAKADAMRIVREPANRVSWMAGLLPYLGHEALYGQIHFDESWRHPSNWSAGQVPVAAFLDPQFPDSSRYTRLPFQPFASATTHYVGIAGVGLDAADFARSDPTLAAKRGILGYEGSESVANIEAGHGLSNTILMIEIPHDNLAGPGPWMASGGATVRGVPEKNSIAPFVLNKDRNGNPITRQEKRGTFALMADGSVRFITQDVSDEVFKAMCTVAGPLPPGYDPNTDLTTSVLPDDSKKDKK